MKKIERNPIFKRGEAELKKQFFTRELKKWKGIRKIFKNNGSEYAVQALIMMGCPYSRPLVEWLEQERNERVSGDALSNIHMVDFPWGKVVGWKIRLFDEIWTVQPNGLAWNRIEDTLNLESLDKRTQRIAWNSLRKVK
jgi:hypothetical protein